MNRLVVATVVALGAAISVPAAADIAPPPGYEETCTLEQVQVAGNSCVECRGSFQDREACATEWSPQGYEKACQTRGASVWTEIWCTAADPAAEGSAEGSAEGTPAEDDADDEAAADEGTTDETDEGTTDEAAATDDDGEEGDDEAQETAPADPPARSRGCATAASGGASAGMGLLLLGLVGLRRRR